MRQQTFRFRRLAGAALGAVTAVSGIAVFGVGAAGALPAPGSALTAASSTVIRPTGTNQAAGNLVVQMTAGSTCVTGDTINLAATDSASAATVLFTNMPSVAVANVPGTVLPSVLVSGAGTGTVTATITCGALSPTFAAGETFTFSGIAYSTTAAAVGGVKVVGTYNAALLGTVSNATVSTTVPTFGVVATAPSLSVGAGVATPQKASNEQIKLGTQDTSWQSGDTISLTVSDGANANCTSATGTIGFGAAPAVTASVIPGQTTGTPTFGAVTLASTGPCSGTTVKNTAVLSFTNGGAIIGTNPPSSATPPIAVNVTGITYTVGSGVTLGAVFVDSAYQSGGAVTLPAFGTPTNNPTPAGPSNATISDVLVTGNTPSVGVIPGAPNAAISPITIAESKSTSPAILPVGFVCVTLNAGVFDASSTPTVAASGGGAVVGTTVVGMGSNTLSFQITTASTAAPATYTLSSLAVDAPPVATLVTVSVMTGATAGCAGGVPQATGARVYTVIDTTRYAGTDAAGTAAESLLAAYPPAGGCVTNLNGGGGLLASPSRAVVLATDSSYQDALSASFLAGHLGTGVLLTDPGNLSAATVNVMRVEGITEVYIVGGPLAISANVISQVKALTAYDCGGTTPINSLLGSPATLSVVGPIFGQTADDTSQAIAEYFGSSAIGSGSFPGAYGTAYNNTTGTSSSAPSTTNAMRTAFLATDGGFQDAASASTVSWNKGFPVLLTPTASLAPQAQQAIVNLGIQQVIVMGGPVAVSNAVVTQLQGMGVSVLRIAGQDYTDTSQLLAQFEQSGLNLSGIVSGLEWGNVHAGNPLVIARGDFYSDAITGSALAGVNQQPILLTVDPNTVGTPLTTFLNNAGSNTALFPTDRLEILGGTLAITPTTQQALFAALAAG